MKVVPSRAALLLVLALGASPSCGGAGSPEIYDYCTDCPGSTYLGTVSDTSAFVGALRLCLGSNDYQVSATISFTPPLAFSLTVVPTSDLCDPEVLWNGGAIQAVGLLPSTPYWFRVVGVHGTTTPLSFTTLSTPAPAPARIVSVARWGEATRFGIVQAPEGATEDHEGLSTRIGLEPQSIVTLGGASPPPSFLSQGSIRWRSWASRAWQAESTDSLDALETDHSQSVGWTFFDVSGMPDEAVRTLLHRLRAGVDEPWVQRVVLVAPETADERRRAHGLLGASSPSSVGAREDSPFRISVPPHDEGWVLVQVDAQGDGMAVTTTRIAADGSTSISVAALPPSAVLNR